jgi:hypothetical protein
LITVFLFNIKYKRTLDAWKSIRKNNKFMPSMR